MSSVHARGHIESCRPGPTPRTPLSSALGPGRSGFGGVARMCGTLKSNKMRTENYHLARALEAQWGGRGGVSGYQRVRTGQAEFLSPVSSPSPPPLRRWSARSRLFLVLQWEKSLFEQALAAQCGGPPGCRGINMFARTKPNFWARFDRPQCPHCGAVSWTSFSLVLQLDEPENALPPAPAPQRGACWARDRPY